MIMIKKIAFFLMLAVLVNVFVLVFAWADRMFVEGLKPFAGLVVVLVTLVVGIPLAVFAARRLFRYLGAKGWMDPSAAFLMGAFILLIGDLTIWLVFGQTTLDIQVHDTLFVIAHVHVVIFIVVVMLFFAGIYAGYPRATGRKMNAPMGYLHFGVTLVALFVIRWPMFYAGVAGRQRIGWESFYRYEWIGVFQTWAAVLLVCGQLLFVVNLVYSGVRGRKYRPGRIDKQT